jgi:hypothetical protein
MNADKVVPSVEVLRQKFAAQQALAAPQGQQALPAPAAGPSPSGQVLMDGAPQVDTFSPPSQG